MSNFKFVEDMNKFYAKKRFLKDRNLSILEFSMRVLDMADDITIPVMERITFIKIVASNIDEFVSTKMTNSKPSYRELYLHTIETIYQRMDSYLQKIAEKHSLEYLNYVSDLESGNSKKIADGGVYFVYYTKDNKFNMVPYNRSSHHIKDSISQLEPKERIVLSFYVRFISDKSFRYVYTGETIEETLLEIKDMVSIKNAEVFHYIETTCPSSTIMDEFIKFIKLPIEGCITVSPRMINFDNVYRTMKRAYTSPELYFPKHIPTYSRHDYYTELIYDDIMIHNPFESYQHVLDFINQMCGHQKIQSIFISLYRVAKDSAIIKSLIMAKELGKNVYVYIEPTARGNEDENVENIELLRSKGIHVACNYFNYKVHSKIFCAVAEDGTIYTHVGTGNYNEATANIYTDLHLLTTNSDISVEVFRIFQALFRKTIYVGDMYDAKLSASPANFRSRILQLIDQEKLKECDGLIIIKCNSLCDSEIIDALYSAAEVGVSVNIICRTGCSIVAHENIIIKSKVGKFLEHERFYIFGDDVFISSADLLLRNISKRLEILCQIDNEDAKKKVFRIFDILWKSPETYVLNSAGKWIKNKMHAEDMF